ncbi:MAG: hypothetical protein HUJ26_05655 [Planctomycetaceae bacterium]|nr:hypothetical protein [Planctomycetaceae bacterium]
MRLKQSLFKIIGSVLVVIGVLIIFLSQTIVTPGLEVSLGIETLVGAENVVYLDNGNYVYTNPGAIFFWITIVILFGLLILSTGFYLVIKSAMLEDYEE